MIEILNYNENLTRGARSNTGTANFYGVRSECSREYQRITPTHTHTQTQTPGTLRFHT